MIDTQIPDSTPPPLSKPLQSTPVKRPFPLKWVLLGLVVVLLIIILSLGNKEDFTACSKDLNMKNLLGNKKSLDVSEPSATQSGEVIWKDTQGSPYLPHTANTLIQWNFTDSDSSLKEFQTHINSSIYKALRNQGFTASSLNTMNGQIDIDSGATLTSLSNDSVVYKIITKENQKAVSGTVTCAKLTGSSQPPLNEMTSSLKTSFPDSPLIQFEVHKYIPNKYVQLDYLPYYASPSGEIFFQKVNSQWEEIWRGESLPPCKIIDQSLSQEKIRCTDDSGTYVSLIDYARVPEPTILPSQIVWQELNDSDFPFSFVYPKGYQVEKNEPSNESTYIRISNNPNSFCVDCNDKEKAIYYSFSISQSKPFTDKVFKSAKEYVLAHEKSFDESEKIRCKKENPCLPMIPGFTQSFLGAPTDLVSGPNISVAEVNPYGVSKEYVLLVNGKDIYTLQISSSYVSSVFDDRGNTDITKDQVAIKMLQSLKVK